MERVGEQAPHLAGIVHLWSLDAETTEAMTSDALMASAQAGLRRRAAAHSGARGDGRPRRRRRLAGDARSAQPIDGIAPTCCEVAQSPLWGFGRVAINEYQNLRCRLVDLATCSARRSQSLAEELDAGAEAEDEIALHGELRYVRRLVPVSSGTRAWDGSADWRKPRSVPHRSAAAGNSRFAACSQCRAHAARTQ